MVPICAAITQVCVVSPPRRFKFSRLLRFKQSKQEQPQTTGVFFPQMIISQYPNLIKQKNGFSAVFFFFRVAYFPAVRA
jgi:hypothetical protein